MEITVREITFRGERVFVVDSPGLSKARQLKLLIESAYNSLLTDPELVEQIPANRETRKSLETLKKSIQDFLDKTELKNYRKTG